MWCTDGCVEVAGAYGAPPKNIGRRVKVQWDTTHVRLLCHKSNLLLREHLRQKPGRYRIAPADVPKRTPKSTLDLLTRAHTLVLKQARSSVIFCDQAPRNAEKPF